MNTRNTIGSRQGLSYFLFTILGLALLGWSNVSAAQVEEIIVTAQKREQNLQEVGVSVTAFTDKQIRELGFVNTTDVVAMTPGSRGRGPTSVRRPQNPASYSKGPSLQIA